jgi:hypothetical protein
MTIMSEVPRTLCGQGDRRSWGTLAVVVVTAACCGSVLINTPIDVSPAGRSIVTGQPAAPAPVNLNAHTPESAVTSRFRALQAADASGVLGSRQSVHN